MRGHTLAARSFWWDRTTGDTDADPLRAVIFDADGAIAAFQEYVRILPQEPNPQDSLGEALLAAGRFKEAEAAFQKALDLSPQFWPGHQGIAYARLYAGDWKGGREAFAQARASQPVIHGSASSATW